MIVRNIEAELRRFFQSQEKKALLVTGARQVGKPYIIEALGRQAFSSFVRCSPAPLVRPGRGRTDPRPDAYFPG